MSVMIALVALVPASTVGALSLSGEIEAAWTRQADGSGLGAGALFGARFGFAPQLGRLGQPLEGYIKLKAGTLGASQDDGTDAATIESTDLRLDAGLFLRYPYEATDKVRVLAGAIVALDNSFQLGKTTIEGRSTDWVASIQGVGYGARFQLERNSFIGALELMVVSHFPERGSAGTEVFFAASGGYRIDF